MKGLSVKKIIIGAILAVVVWLVAVFAVRKISYKAIMGEARDVSDYYEFELDDVEKIVTERYADDDNVIREKCYGSEGEPWWYIDYNYDKEGNVKKEAKRSDYLEDMIGAIRYTNKYDDGNLVEVKVKGGHTRELEYDRDGNIVSDVYLCDDVCWSCYKEAYEYDDDGNVVKIERHYANNNRGERVNISYVYDSKGDLVEEYSESETKEAHLYKTYDTEYVGKDLTITFEEVEVYEGSTRCLAVIESGRSSGSEAKAVRDIASRAFKGNDKLTSVVIEGMEYISDFAFVDCSALKEVVLPDGIKKLGDGVFEDCSSLTSIEIPDSVTKMGTQTFFNCSSLRSVTLPAELTTIESETFAKCYALSNVKIPDGVTDIVSQAFSHCGLESIELSGGVKTIGFYAFDDDIVLHVEAGSYEEEWARFNGYTVVTRGGQDSVTENTTTEESESGYASDKESTFDTAALQNAEIGNYVMFGSYEQNNNYEDGQEPIEWLVIDKRYGYLVLLSKHGLNA